MLTYLLIFNHCLVVWRLNFIETCLDSSIYLLLLCHLGRRDYQWLGLHSHRWLLLELTVLDLRRLLLLLLTDLSKLLIWHLDLLSLYLRKLLQIHLLARLLLGHHLLALCVCLHHVHTLHSRLLSVL